MNYCHRSCPYCNPDDSQVLCDGCQKLFERTDLEDTRYGIVCAACLEQGMADDQQGDDDASLVAADTAQRINDFRVAWRRLA